MQDPFVAVDFIGDFLDDTFDCDEDKFVTFGGDFSCGNNLEPVDFNFGIPFANKPPRPRGFAGAAILDAELEYLFTPADDEESDDGFPAINGELRSLITFVFFNLVPDLISESSALLSDDAFGNGAMDDDFPPEKMPGGGGGGGGADIFLV